MKLFELFDRPLPYEFTSSGSDYEATFDVDGREYQVEISMMGEYSMIIEFFDDEGEQSITGGGDSIAVFSTVVAIVKEAVQKLKPRTITFSASGEEPSRVKLYKRLSQTIGKDLGYNVNMASGLDPKYILTKLV